MVSLWPAAFLSGCGDPPPDPLIQRAEDAVRAQLKDPDSSEFRNVSRCGTGQAATGDVNAKNGFGGYVGYVHFYYADGDAGLVDDGSLPGTEAWLHNAQKWSRLARQCEDGVAAQSNAAARQSQAVR